MTNDTKCFTHNITNTIDAASCTSYYIASFLGVGVELLLMEFRVHKINKI